MARRPPRLLLAGARRLNGLEVAFVPPGLSPGEAGLLVGASGIGSFVTAAFGAGGGALLLGLMTVFLPTAAAIPLHGVVQAGSNVGRTAILCRHVHWGPWLAFTIGTATGAAAGSALLVRVPEFVLDLALGAFLLWSCIGHGLRYGGRSRAALVVGGAATGLLTLFAGATGPLVATLVRPLGFDRLAHVATFSACMLGQHGLKIAVFGLAGFGFAPYVPFLLAMLAVGFAGTLLGRLVLGRLDDRLFRRVLRWLLGLIALRLLYSGAVAALG